VADVTTIVLVVGAVATLLTIVFVTMVLIQRVTRAYRDAARSVERLQPALQQIAEHQEFTRRELDRLAETRASGR
jgi:Tfp pilus assembly protein PilX